MFSIEIKVNGGLVVYVYGQNMGLNGDLSDFVHKYKYNYFRPSDAEVTSGEVEHKMADGIESLGLKILQDIMKSKSS